MMPALEHRKIKTSFCHANFHEDKVWVLQDRVYCKIGFAWSVGVSLYIFMQQEFEAKEEDWCQSLRPLLSHGDAAVRQAAWLPHDDSFEFLRFPKSEPRMVEFIRLADIHHHWPVQAEKLTRCVSRDGRDVGEWLVSSVIGCMKQHVCISEIELLGKCSYIGYRQK